MITHWFHRKYNQSKSIISYQKRIILGKKSNYNHKVLVVVVKNQNKLNLPNAKTVHEFYFVLLQVLP